MRSLRDIVAEAMRRERLGLMRPLWADLDDVFKQQWLLRADVLIRIASEYGVSFGGAGLDCTPVPEIYRFPVFGGGAERVIRRNGDLWEIVTVTQDKTEVVNQTFALADAWVEAGMVLADDPAAKALSGLGRRLAAALEIHRMHAGGRDGR